MIDLYLKQVLIIKALRSQFYIQMTPTELLLNYLFCPMSASNFKVKKSFSQIL